MSAHRDWCEQKRQRQHQRRRSAAAPHGDATPAPAQRVLEAGARHGEGVWFFEGAARGRARPSIVARASSSPSPRAVLFPFLRSMTPPVAAR
jgi:hypothetical protein